MTRSMSKSAVKRKTKRENRGNLEDLNQTYHSNPPFKAAEAADQKSQDPLDVIVNQKEDGSQMTSHRNMSSIMSVNSVAHARKMRELKEMDVRKLHNRIALLQAEEEKALKKIEETKLKAHMMLENKL